MPSQASPFTTEYNYDYPQPHPQPRSISPLLFCPTMYTSSKQQSRAADISRLLDPSYRSASPTKGYVSPQAYVDPYGDLHDPDYRHFPTSFPSSSSSSTKRQNSPRPHWEWTLDSENALDDDELDEEDTFFLSTSTAAHPQNHSRYSAARRSSHNSFRRRPRESSFSTYTTTYSSNYYSPAGTHSTLPTSYESDKTVLSRCSDIDEKDVKKTKKRRRLSKGDKEKEKEKEREGSWGGSGVAAVVAAETYYRGSLDRSRDLPPTEEEEAEDDQHARLGPSATSAKGASLRSKTRKEVEFVPSCTYSIRRQWQALSLRFRFGVFRAQRKVMRRVHSLLWVWVGSSSSRLFPPTTTFVIAHSHQKKY